MLEVGELNIAEESLIDLKPMDKAKLISKLRQKFNYTCLEIAHVIHESESTVTRLSKLTKLIDEFQEMVELGEIGLTKAYHLAGLDAEIQRTLYQTVRKKIVNRNRIFVEHLVRRNLTK